MSHCFFSLWPASYQFVGFFFMKTSCGMILMYLLHYFLCAFGGYRSERHCWRNFIIAKYTFFYAGFFFIVRCAETDKNTKELYEKAWTNFKGYNSFMKIMINFNASRPFSSSKPLKTKIVTILLKATISKSVLCFYVYTKMLFFLPF